MAYKSESERMCYALGLEEILESIGVDDPIATLERDIYAYVNHEALQKEYADDGGMERPREFYADRILKAMEVIFHGKSEKEIESFCKNLIS